MDDLAPQLQDALATVQTEWTDHRSQTALEGLGRKRARRATYRAGATVATLAIAVLAAVTWRQRDPVQATRPAHVAPESVAVVPGSSTPDLPEAGVVLSLHDGSTVTPEAGATAAIVQDSANKTVVEVTNGRHRFALRATPTRPFVVTTGKVRIEVHSSEFAVARFDTGAEVWAYDGYVRIQWQGDVRELRAGEHARLADNAPTQLGGRPPEVAENPAQQVPTAPEQAVSKHEKRDVTQLMREADGARTAGRPHDAVQPLRTVLDKYPHDARAPLAAFTLGRVLLDELSQPEAAARAFRLARRLAPRGALSEDALAREVEAWAAAGDSAKARTRAELYLKRYPDGHRVRAVRQYADK